jgi:hypothetical protein
LNPDLAFFSGLIWPPRGLTQEGEGMMSVAASSPWPVEKGSFVVSLTHKVFFWPLFEKWFLYSIVINSKKNLLKY